MKINFKYHRLADEWLQLLLINPKLVYIVLALAEQLGGNITLTHIYRTEAQQKHFYPKSRRKSVHQLNRGVDVRTWGYSKTKVAGIIQRLSARFPYGKEPYSSFIQHNTGYGSHIHVQTKGV